jgi:hypothetical protein
LVVRHVREDYGAGSKDYDFSTLPISRELQAAFARAFAARTRPGGGLRAAQSADQAFRWLAGFATYLTGLQQPRPISPDCNSLRAEPGILHQLTSTGGIGNARLSRRLRESWAG